MNRKEQEELLQLLDEKLEREQKEYYTDVEYFIERMVNIEDLDSPEINVPFKLWDGQKKALNEIIENRFNIVLKARQLGLTWLALAIALHYMIIKRGYKVIALSRTDDDAKKLVKRIDFIIRHLPKWLITLDDKRSQYNYTITASSVTIIGKGEDSLFESKPASADSGRSLTANLVIIDEWAMQQFAQEIYVALYPTINRPNGGKIIGISTAKKATLFEDKWNEAYNGLNKFNPIFLSWRTDPRRDDKWYEDTVHNLGEAFTKQEYPDNPQEAFLASAGLYFKGFNPDVHVVEPFPIPKHYDRYTSTDYGRDMYTTIWFAVDENGNTYAYKMTYEKDLLVSDACALYKEVNDGDDIVMNYAPPDLYGKDSQTGKSVRDIFAENGVYFTKSDNSRISGWLSVREFLKIYENKHEQTGEVFLTSKLKIFSNCKDLIRTLPQLQEDIKNISDVSKHPHELTHAPDALRGFCIMRQGYASPLKAKPEYEEYEEFDDYGDEEEGFY